MARLGWVVADVSRKFKLVQREKEISFFRFLNSDSRLIQLESIVSIAIKNHIELMEHQHFEILGIVEALSSTLTQGG